MKFKINYTVNGEEDSVIIEDDTVEECRKKAQAEMKVCGATNIWSTDLLINSMINLSGEFFS